MQTSSWLTARHWFAPVPVLFAALLLGGTLAPPPARAADSYDPNLLANGSFEDGFTAWQIYLRWGFQNVTFHTADTNVIHAGRISARVEATELPENAGWRQTVAVIPHTRYRLSGWIKTANLRSGSGGAATLAVLAPGIDFLLVSDPVTGTADWTYAELLFNSQEFSTLEIRAGLGTQGRTLGTAWFDDLQLREVIPRPFISGPADATATNELNASLTVEVTSPIPVEIQWLKNGVPIPEATRPVLELPAVTPPDSGRYSVAVRNAGGVATSRAALLEIVPGPRNQPPLLTALETAPLQFQRTLLPITTTLVLADADNSHLLGATVAITAGYIPLEDLLYFTDTDSITGRFDVPTGVLMLAGKATVAEYQTALRSIQYLNPRLRRTPGTRTYTLAAWDGVTPSLPVVRTLHPDPPPGRTRVIAWGNNDAGQATVPANLATIVATAAGGSHSLALHADGTVTSRGGNPAAPETRVPDGLRDVVALAANGAHNLALRADGTVVAWGSVPAPADLANVVAIATGRDHGLALLADGTLRGWGRDTFNYSQYDPDCDCVRAFAIPFGQATPPPGNNFVAIAAGDTHSLALRADGGVVDFGALFEGFGDYPGDVYTSRPLGDAAANATQISAWGETGSLLGNDGVVSVYGHPLGLPGDLRNVLAVSPYAALTADGSVVSWGPPGPAPQLANVFHLASARHALAVIALPPTALPQTVTGREDTDLLITLATDAPAPTDDLTTVITTLPANGTLYQCLAGRRGAPIATPATRVTDPQRRVIYAPTPQANGAPFDSFQFTVVEGARASAPARVTIHITAVNDPPIAGFGLSLAVPGASSAELTRPPFASPTSDFTIELWLRTAVLNDGYYHGILGRHLAGGTTNRSPSLWQGPDRGALHLDSLATDGRRFGLLLPGFFQETGAWLHLALVKQGTACRIYRNGRLFGAGQAPAAVRILANGYSFGRVDNYFRGHLDDLRIWQTARTETEIRADAGRPLTGHEPGLLGAWLCNEGGGKLLRDLAPARNHARLTGSAAFSPLTPPLTWETPRNAALAGWLPAADFEGDPLRFNTVTAPRSGTLFIDPNGRFTYTPRTGFAGTDTFAYRVNDGRLNSPAAPVTLRVTGTTTTATNPPVRR